MTSLGMIKKRKSTGTKKSTKQLKWSTKIPQNKCLSSNTLPYEHRIHHQNLHPTTPLISPSLSLSLSRAQTLSRSDLHLLHLPIDRQTDKQTRRRQWCYARGLIWVHRIEMQSNWPPPLALSPFSSTGVLSGDGGFDGTRALLFTSLIFFQGGGGGGMDLSKVGEKILTSVRSARSLGLLPPTSDRPEVITSV